VAYPSSHRHLLSFLFNHTATPEIYTLSLHDALPIYVFNPTDILWALATRVQPHGQISITEPIFRGNTLDPSLVDYIKTSCMIVDATKPLDRPFSPVSKCPDEAMQRIKLEDYVPGEVLQHIPLDRTTYWA